MKAVLVTLGKSRDEQEGKRLCLNTWMKNCNELALKAVTAVFRTEIKAADFLSSDVYSRIRRKLLVIRTQNDKGIGPLFLHLKAVSLGMQRLFHFLENHSFFCWHITTIACSYFILR